MIKRRNLIISTIILSLVVGGVVLPLDFAFSQSYKVVFSGYMQPWGSGGISYMEGSINLPYNGRYGVATYYSANSGRDQLHEEYKVLVDGKYIGQTSDPNITAHGPDYENENLGEHNFSAGNHQVRLEHLWNYGEVGYQSVHPKNVTFTLKETFKPSLSLSKSVDKSTAQEGDILTYTLSYQNTGSGSATGVGLSDDFDENYLDIYDASGGTVSGGKINWNIGNLGAGSSGTKIFKVKVKDDLPQGTTYIYNKGTIDSTQTDPSQSNTVSTKVTIANNPPVADAGPDKEVSEGQSITLDGSGSDPDGDPITYSWSCTGGYLSNRYTARPTFDAPSVSYDRTYTCTLTVTDDKGLTDSDSMRVRVLNQEEEEVCSKSDSSCSNPDGYMYIGDSRSGCLNSTDWKYYKVRESSGEKIEVELSWSGTGCNVNDLIIYKSNCSQIYSEENNSWTKTWEGTPSSDIIIGLDGDSSNKDCRWNLRVTSLGQGELSVKKSVKNVSRGDTTWYNIYRSADPSDELLFRIVVKSTGDTEIRDVKVKDDLPSNIIYQGNLEIDNVSKTKNISTQAVNIGDLSPGESKTLIFEAKVAAKENFSFGTTDLINTARAYTSETSDSDTCKVKVTRKGVAGVVTGVSNRIIDSLLLPLGIALTIVWIFKSKFIGLDKWAQERKKEIGEYRAKKTLKKKITQLKDKGYFKE
ncbi:DUF11 domain-containing protein [Patescibacteria group bacterium]|nr:DUF11 domain-containing protein [Patescibacteria group bacterium]